MAARKSNDEAQADVTEATEADVVAQAKAARAVHHESNGRSDFKEWDDLSEEKRQRWLDEVTA